MASRQEKEQRKETEASELSDVNRDKERERHEERPGVIGSFIKAVQSAKEAVVGKTNDEHGTRNEDVGYCDGEVEETTESTVRTLEEKAREMKENPRDAANETKGYAAEQVREATERTKQMVEHEATGTAKEKPREVQEDARRMEEEMGMRDRDKYEGDLAGRVLDDKDEGKEDRGGRILGALGALKEKLTPHRFNGNKTRRSTDASRVEVRNEGEKKAQRTSEEQVEEVYMGDSSPGAIASTLKASGQMTGQTFNEVGRIDDEGVIRIVRRDLQGKM